MRYDPFDFEIQQNPYPYFEWLRNEHPIYHVEKHDLWVLSRYDDILSVLRDWQSFSNREGVDIDKTDTLLSPGNMDEKDGPEHDVYRKLVQPWFSPKAFKTRLEDPIRQETKRLIANLVDKQSGDVTVEISWQLPTFVIARMFDAPMADREALLSYMAPVFARVPNDPVPPPQAMAAGKNIEEYCLGLIAERRREDLSDRDDVISLLLRSSLDGEALSDRQILGIIAHLIVASSGTTQDLITNAVWLLAEHPEERAKLVADPAGIPTAIEECLRYETVVQSVSRVTNDVTIHHGIEVPAGAEIVNLLGSANRDERYWDDPKRFDVSRKPRRHLGFADGIHHCIGAPIARMEARIVLEELLAVAPDYELDGEPVRAVAHVARGLEHLYITMGHSRS